MDILSLVVIACGLAMDAFAVSIASGVIIQRQKIRQAVTFGLMFGGFQMVMPVLGYGAGWAFRSYISAIDHWVAFGLLCGIGFKMMYEAFRLDDIERSASDITGFVLLGLAIATSVDALAVGISFAVLRMSILVPVLIIGGMTFVLSFFGVLLGSRFGGFFEKKVEIIGGFVLIGMGCKILIDHLKSVGS
jgi:putative Mn2+ efflux pump MntP